ncbi:MAG: FKBP-type peptidyl-prolyl cis-trans isomerase [Candidatus Sumerlaeia bacterium]
MRKRTLVMILALCLSMMTAWAADEAATDADAKKSDIKIETDKDKISYVLGVNIGMDLKNSGIDVNPEVLAEAIRAAVNEEEFALSDEEMMQAMQLFQQQMQQAQMKQQQEMQASGQENQAEGEKFLTANAERDAVKTTKSGLQYEVLREGEGKQPEDTDTVKVHYKGTFIDGEQFDSSYERNTPAEFPLNGVIPGWTEGLQLMKEGAKYKFYIPGDLAYGAEGRGSIPPNKTLVFEVELLEVVE